tara:strand:- start:371 stop:685 length:315 start_codon:yes stop_codon:yes gene_type:complete
MEKDSRIKIKEMRIDGGMVSNNSFVQSLSNILQINVIKPKNIETTGLGVAYLAALNCGILKNTSDISKLWKSEKVYKPNISKILINKKIIKWKKTIELLIKYYS